MPIIVGSTPVQAIYVGSTPVQEVYVGSTKIWPSETPPPLQWTRWGTAALGYVYTNSRNPAMHDPYYVKNGDEYVEAGEVVPVGDWQGYTTGITLDRDPTEYPTAPLYFCYHMPSTGEYCYFPERITDAYIGSTKWDTWIGYDEDRGAWVRVNTSADLLDELGWTTVSDVDEDNTSFTGKHTMIVGQQPYEHVWDIEHDLHT